MNVVLMTTYNGEKHIEVQIKSILSQFQPDDLLLISDDGSTDKTVDIIKSFNLSCIELFQRGKNRKIYKESYLYTTDNINYLLSICPNCDLIFLADQDDVWLHHKYKLFVSAAADMTCILSDCSYVDENLNFLADSKFESDGVNSFGVFSSLIKTPFLGACMAFDFRLLKYVYPIPHNVPHDMWIGFISQIYGRVQVLKESTLLYRRHCSSLTYSNVKYIDGMNGNRRSLWRKLHSRIDFIFSLLARLINIKFSS
jgi:glycosyltransferase involved in cell wall biosynthesis